ncbi:MAG: hypothetical protein HQL10_03730 [Nitrospirae bacterium]|nr:hypothetical protein [Nitrospirota bacterium]
MPSEYSLASDGAVIRFSTTHFTAEKGSILHSGIYNKEMTASLAAGAVIFVLGFIFADKIKITFSSFFAFIGSFAALFLFFRTVALKDRLLTAEFDSFKKSLQITVKSVFGEKQRSYNFSDISVVVKNTLSLVPENPDGVQMVEKIALQHHTVIPGFGQASEFHTVSLALKSGEELMIFSSKNQEVSDEVHRLLNEILR